MSHILIIEDEEAIARLISLELQHEGYEVSCAADGRKGLNMALDEDFDLILLDLMLPSLNGIEVLRRLRQSKQTPVIILTARDQVMDKVVGLDIGANDYMTKPFATEELLARIRVNIRKVGVIQPEIIVANGLRVELSSRKVEYNGTEIALTKKEFDLLVYLLRNCNTVLSREKILDEVWGYDYYGNTNVVDVYVRYLRAKIDDIFDIKLICTVRGSGYMIRK